MLIRRPADIPSSEITPEPVYLNRRQFIRGATGAAVGVATGGLALGGSSRWSGTLQKRPRPSSPRTSIRLRADRGGGGQLPGGVDVPSAWRVAQRLVRLEASWGASRPRRDRATGQVQVWAWLSL